MNNEYKNIVCCLKNKNGYLLRVDSSGVCYTKLKYETDDFSYAKARQVKNRIKKHLGIDLEIIVKYSMEEVI